MSITEVALRDDESDEMDFAGSLWLALNERPDDVRLVVESIPDGALVSEAADWFLAVKSVTRENAQPTRGDALRWMRENANDGVPALIDWIDGNTCSESFAVSEAQRLGDALTRRYHRRLIQAAALELRKNPFDQGTIREILASVPEPMGAKKLTAMDAIMAWRDNKVTPTVATGCSWFDDATDGGLPIGGLVAFVAPPGVGKTAIMTQLALSAMEYDRECRVVMAAGEGSLASIGRKLAVTGSRIFPGCNGIGMHEPMDSEWAGIAARTVAGAIGDRLSLIQSPLSVESIESRIVQTGARLVVIDYLQLIRGPEAGRDRVSDLDAIIGQIRDFAIRHEVAVIFASSMAKTSNTTTSRAGQLSRGSGEIDYACEIVYAAEVEEKDGRPVIGEDRTKAVTWRCAKARNLEPKDLVLRFHGETQRYIQAEVPSEYEAFANPAW